MFPELSRAEDIGAKKYIVATGLAQCLAVLAELNFDMQRKWRQWDVETRLKILKLSFHMQGLFVSGACQFDNANIIGASISTCI